MIRVYKTYLLHGMVKPLFIILLCSYFYGCGDTRFNDSNRFKDDSRIQTVNGSWRVISFEDFVLEEIEFPNQTNSRGLDIVVTFNDLITPYDLSGQNTTNTIQGNFDYISPRQVKIVTLASTRVAQPEWGDKFSDAMLNESFEFIISESRLRFYYNDRKNSITFAKQ